jgi:GSH-dependent disulfide-bond oxidoreductase
MFVASGLGPFSGQAAHFSQVYADSPYATNRYRRKLERHYAVLDRHLGGRPYLVGDSYTIVDMAAWGWVDRAGYNLKQDAPLDRWSNLKLWFGNIDSRPAVARASSVGRDAVLKTEFDEETLRLSSRRIFPKSPEVRQNANLAGGKTR